MNLLAVTFVEALSWVGYIIVALLCLMVMIVIHELGHYSAGKLLKFKINEFSIGFGPAIFKRKSKKTGELFAIRCIPLGGYCAFEGEDEDENGEGASDKAFNKQKPWKRIIVLAAGAVFNFVSAIFIISIFFMAFGDFAPKIETVTQLDGGVVQAFEKGDVILKVDGKGTYCLINQNDLGRLLTKSGDKATVLVIRQGEKIEIEVNKGYFNTTDENGNSIKKDGYGISYGFMRYKYGFFQSIGKAFVFSFKVVGMLFSTLAGLFTGVLGIKGTIGGPITAIGSIANLSRGGFDAIMYGLCTLSATLAIMNLLPIPSLDGSRIVFTVIEAIRKKPMKRKTEGRIHAIGLIILFSLVIILDIVNLL